MKTERKPKRIRKLRDEGLKTVGNEHRCEQAFRGQNPHSKQCTSCAGNEMQSAAARLNESMAPAPGGSASTGNGRRHPLHVLPQRPTISTFHSNSVTTFITSSQNSDR
jgi:hypothetical protein